MRDLTFAAARARWLAEVEGALGEAMILVERMGGTMRNPAERTELLEQIEVARRKTRTLRLRSHRPIECDLPPKWTSSPFGTRNGGRRSD